MTAPERPADLPRPRISTGTVAAVRERRARRLDWVLQVTAIGIISGLLVASALDIGVSYELVALGAVLVLLVTQRVIRRGDERARALEEKVLLERELSTTLEHFVTDRTVALTEAQRVLQRMWDLGHEISAELHPARVLQRFMEAVMDIEQCDGVVLALAHESGTVRVFAASGDGAPFMGMELPIAGSGFGQVIRSGAPLAVPDIAAQPDLLHPQAMELLRAHDIHAVAIVPLRRQQHNAGAVAILARRRRDWADVALRRIEAMVDMLSVARANAELVENLRKAESRFRTLFRAAPDAVLTILQGGDIREANDCARDLTGVAAESLVGGALLDLVVPEDRPVLQQALDAAFRGAQARLEIRFPREQGTRVIAVALTGLPDADPPSVLLLGRDITGEREMRSRLMETERLAAIGELVAGVAHEVNNPLGSISAFAQLLLRDATLVGDHRESVEVIRSETLRASQVVKDLLAFARRSPSERHAIDLNDVVERSVRLRGYQLATGHVQLELRLASALPNVDGDQRQLQQVVLNLVTNAIQAMAPQTTGTLRIATRVDGTDVVLEVSDTGTGVPMSVRPHIFEPFFTTKPEGEGTGLGLSVSYGIIAAHGGRIQLVDTPPGTGATFVMTFPAAVDVMTGRPSGEHARAVTRSPLQGLRVLIVDDEPSLRSSVEAFGRLRGFSVVTAEDGFAGLRAVEGQTFDAVVCDLRMPGMDGLAFHEALRSSRPGLAERTIFITGDVMDVSGRLGPVSRQPVLPKPFTFERLEEALAGVVRGDRPSGVTIRDQVESPPVVA